MDKRELRFNVCTVLAAAIVSASVLSIWGAMPMSANTTRPALNIEIRKDAATYFRRLKIDTPQPPDTVKRGMREKDGSESSAAPAPVATSATACEAAMILSRKIDAVLEKSLPAKPANADVRMQLKKIQDEASRYCTHASPPAKPISAKEVDNDCEQFTGAPARMIECEVREKMGQTYRGY